MSLSSVNLAFDFINQVFFFLVDLLELGAQCRSCLLMRETDQGLVVLHPRLNILE